jgi:hypothetical protein
MFPGEDALILQELTQGSSPGAFDTLEQTEKNLLNEAGYTEPLSREEGAAKLAALAQEGDINRRPLEPLSPLETSNPLPRTIRGKQTELQRIVVEQQKLLDEGTISPEGLSRGEGADILRRSAKLSERREIIENALSEQRAVENSKRVEDRATQSALNNTKQQLGTAGQTTPINTTKVVNPGNKTLSDKIFVAADRSQRLSETLAEIADDNQKLADEAAARGANRLALDAQIEANKNRLESEVKAEQARLLRIEAENIEPVGEAE